MAVEKFVATWSPEMRAIYVASSDKNLQALGIFTQEELSEIEQYSKKKIHVHHAQIFTRLNLYKKNNVEDIRRQIFKSEKFDQEYNKETDSDYNWVRNSCYNLPLEYEANSLKTTYNVI